MGSCWLGGGHHHGVSAEASGGRLLPPAPCRLWRMLSVFRTLPAATWILAGLSLDNPGPLVIFLQKAGLACARCLRIFWLVEPPTARGVTVPGDPLPRQPQGECGRPCVWRQCPGPQGREVTRQNQDFDLSGLPTPLTAAGLAGSFPAYPGPLLSSTSVEYSTGSVVLGGLVTVCSLL